jgi:signal transduction histidine kinase
MKERDLFLCVVTLAAAALSFTEGGPSVIAGESLLLPAARASTQPRDLVAVLILATAVLVCAVLFARTMRAPRPVASVLLAASCATAVICSPDTALPVITASVASILCDYARTPVLIAVTSAVTIADALIARPGATPTMEASLVGAGLIYALSLLGRRDAARRTADERGDLIEILRERARGQSRLAQSRERISKLEERNRLAARIHDEIGHGMSGSVLLLEGADLIMDKDPERARATLRRVTENLRESTDKIRAVLREERSDRTEANLARIRAGLASFETEHPRMRASLTTNGDTDSVSGAVWTCVMDTMTEAMTNTLKHSDATEFHVSVTNSNKLLTVEFSDNGSARSATPPGAPGVDRSASRNADRSAGEGSTKDHPHKGMGLQNMEERCSLAYGRCFFHHGPDGFRIVMTFPQKDQRHE